MKEFEYFIREGVVKKQASDANLARGSVKSGRERLELAKSVSGSQKPKFVLENAYESMREVIDGALYLEGFKSFSHEASIAFLLKLGFSTSEMHDVDRLRRKRNGIKYYGEESSKDEARESLQVAEKVIKKILEKKPKLA